MKPFVVNINLKSRQRLSDEEIGTERTISCKHYSNFWINL